MIKRKLMNLAPIILFVYNRPKHTKETLEALNKNIFADQSVLYIFSDAAKNDKGSESVNEVRDLIKTVKGFKEVLITEREKNLGLANSIISGVTEIINKCGRAIVLEDDIVTSPHFLKFMNEALEFYRDDKRIYSISGYNFPIKIPESYQHQVYISPRPSSWGWATWKNRWEKVNWSIDDFKEFILNSKEIENFGKGGDDLVLMLINQMNKKVDSWAIRWAYHHYKSKSSCLYPCYSFARNIGADSTGTHLNSTRKFNVKMSNDDYDIVFKENISENQRLLNEFRTFFAKTFISKLFTQMKIYYLRNSN